MSTDSTHIHDQHDGQADAHGHSETGQPEASHNAAHGAGHHEGSANPRGSDVFTHLLGTLGDHHELDIFFLKAKVLPVILVDDGLHVYANVDDMEAAGEYTLHNPKAGHHIVSTTKVDTSGEPVAPTLDLSITNFVAYQILAVVLIISLFAIARSRYKKNPKAAPKGIQNVLESIVLYIHDEIVRPNVGTDKRAKRVMPIVTSLFFFILALNLVGLLPGGHSASGALGVTAALALVSFFTVNYFAVKDGGIGAWFHHLLGGAPVAIAPIMIIIEIVSLFTKPFALMIRLFANMTAGHIVLLSLVGLIFFFESWAVTPVSVAFSVFIYLLELLVAFLQAYIFSMLTAVFIGLALGDHVSHDKHHAHAH